MYDLGRVTGYIRINADDAVRGYAKTRAAHAQTMSALERSAMTTKRIGLAFTTVGVAALAGFGVAVKATADFEKRMSFVQALTKATPAQMDKVRASTFKLGQQFGISSNDVADAMVELGKAGVTIPQLTGGVAKATVTLARSADITAADAAKNIVGLTATFEKGAKDAVHVANLLQGSANAAIIDVEDVAYAMRYAGSTAHTFGIKLGDLTDVVTILGQANIRGSQAGTSLRRMMIQMTGPTSTAHDALLKLGIITKDGTNQFFKANGQMRPFQQNINILRMALRRLNPQQRISALNTIFGSRAIAAANVLLKTSNKEWGRFHNAVRQTTAAEIARKRLDNLAGALDKFKAALDVALIRAGAPAQKPLMQLVEHLTRLVQAFGALPAATQQSIVKLVLITGVVFTLLGAFMLLTSFVFRLFQTWKMFKEMQAAFMGMRVVEKIIYELRFAFLQLGEALGTLFLNPVGLTILAIAALGVAAYELYKHWAPFRNLVNSVGKWFVWLGKTIIGGLKSAFDWVKAHGALIAAGLMVMFPMLAPFIAALYELLHHWRGVWTAIKVTVGVLAAIWKVEWGIMMRVVRIWWRIVGPLFRANFALLKGYFHLFWAIVKSVWKFGWDLARNYVVLAWHEIKNVVMFGVHLIENIVKIIADILDGKWGKAWSDAKHLVSQAIHDIWNIIRTFGKDAIKLLYQAGRDIVMGLINGIKAVAEGPAKAIYGIGKSVVKNVVGFFGIGSPSRLMHGLGQDITVGLAQGIDDGGDAAVRAIQNVLAKMWSVIGPGINAMVDSINSFLSTWGTSSAYDPNASAGAAEHNLLADQRKAILGNKPKRAHHVHFQMPSGVDLSGADPNADFSGGAGDTSSGSKKKKKKAEQKRVDLRLLFQSGQWIMDGFRKGMEQGAKGVRAFQKRLTERIKSYWNKAKGYGDKAGMRALEQLQKQVDRYGAHLLRLAQHRDKVIRKIEAQQKHLDNLISAKADYAKAVRDSIVSLGEINAVVTKVDASGNPDVTSDNIVQGLKTTVAAVKEYDDELQRLLAMGLNKKTYDQLVQEGPEAGGAYARALLDGGKSTIKEVNKLEQELDKEAIKMGQKTSATMYDSGIKAARGIIQGLRDKKGDITKIMVEVAHTMVNTLKKELGIKSPSRVMHRMGQFTTQGYAMGILAEAKRVQRAAATLSAAAIPQASSYSARGAGVSAPALRVSATLPDGYSRPDVSVTQNIKSTDPKRAADESARKMRTIAQMGAFG